ncbi:LacI family DNA-binding transcriptional regulator [Rhizobium sp. BK251]|uniref:LacI family DNA-binding transcriptional regulator n=1 Tax=Rhizobium sp. BK251 TaxID=2512125 RepID=UPI00104D9CF6|nr:LacI family DNA-binding transcriptional regulator [Rhizobium sp. BK251]TCL68422.1 LacI family transcriptional regulator [Rhizobium sp. BK251]
MRRPTIADLAKASGVSVATIDRVLNGRHRVREETARRVYDAAQAIGYHAVGLLRQRVFEDLPHYRLGFLLQKGDQAFYQNLSAAFTDACSKAERARVTCQIDFTGTSTPAIIGEKLRALAARNQAIGLVAPDYPGVSAVVEELRERGIAVFSLLSDFAAGVRAGYIGLNNRKVGRTAAWIVTKAARRPGKIACFVGSHRFQGHEMREIGFRSYFRENAPEFEVLETMVNLDTSEITHEATINLLQQHKDLVGLYPCGGGMEGAIAALREEGRAGELAVVVNELTQESRQALVDEIATAAISTPVAQLAAEAVRLMIAVIEEGQPDVPGQTFLPFDIFISENI